MNKKRIYYIIAPIFALCVGLLPGVMFSTGTLRREKASEAVNAPALSAFTLHASVNSAAFQIRGVPVSITGLVAQDGVYTGAPHSGYAGTPRSAFAGEYDILYTGRDSTVYGPSETPPTDAGRYTVTFRIPEANPFFEGSASLDFSIAKAAPAGEPQYTPLAEEGKTLADAGLTAEGGTFVTEGSVSWVLDGSTEVKADAPYTWVFTPDDRGNYDPSRGVIAPYSTTYVPDATEGGSEGSNGAPAVPSDDGDAPTYLSDTVTLDAAGKDGSSYQWQVNRNDGSGWMDIPGATEAEYTTPPIEEEHTGYQYRCAVTGPDGTDYTFPYVVPAVDLPQTGGSPSPWAAAAMLALSALAAAIPLRRKRKDAP